jgi:hypothetical protein
MLQEERISGAIGAGGGLGGVALASDRRAMSCENGKNMTCIVMSGGKATTAIAASGRTGNVGGELNAYRSSAGLSCTERGAVDQE